MTDKPDGAPKRPSITDQEALQFHSRGRPGKLEIVATKPMATQRDLSLAYSPGVAVPVKAIAADPSLAYDYTVRGNMIAVITNGTAILGLGNLGALAAKPVMEGKAVLFKRFADIDSIDLEVDTEDPEEFINSVRYLSPSFGGINLEDIKAPECFIIEERLREVMTIPVFHDDQHGTAIIAAAGMINAIQLTGRDIKTTRLVCNGAGAAGIACLDLIKAIGFEPSNVMLCDTKGVVYRGRKEGMNQWKSAHAVDTPLRTLAEAMVGADIFFGLSAKGALTPEMVKSMAPSPIIFAMANPDPEITPEDAQKVRDDVIMATGRSDYPNQVNNVLGFPYIFRGALDVRAKTINMEMKIAAVHALAELAREDVPDEVAVAYRGARPRFGRDYIIPVPFDPRLIQVVPIAVAKAAMASGVAQRPIVDIAAYKAQLSARRDPIAGAMQRIIERVRRMPKRVVFAEGEEEQVIRAAYSFVNQGLGTAILVGREDRVRAVAQQAGFDLAEKGVEIHNARLSHRNALYAQFLYERLQRRGFLLARLPAPDQSGPQYFRRRDGGAGRRRRAGDRRDAQLLDRARGGPPRHRPQARPSRHRRFADPGARPADPGRRHGDHRNADLRGSRPDRGRGGRRRAPPRLRAARGHARLFQLRPSAGRAHVARAGGRAPARRAARRFRIRRRNGGRRRAQQGADERLPVLPTHRHRQRAGDARLPFGRDLDPDGAGARRRDGDRAVDRRVGKAGADRLAGRQGLRHRQHGDAGELQYRGVSGRGLIPSSARRARPRGRRGC